MEWNEIAKHINAFRSKFDKSYKCINKDAVIKTETLKNDKYIKTVIDGMNLCIYGLFPKGFCEFSDAFCVTLTLLLLLLWLELPRPLP